MNGLRILMTTDTLGGVWTDSRELAGELSRRGMEVLVAALGATPRANERRELERAGVELVSRPLRLEWMRDAWEDLARTRGWIRELARAWRPDVVHLNSFGAGDAGLAEPTLTVGHSCVPSWWRAVLGSPLPEDWRRYRELVATSLRSADLVVAPTAWMLGELVREYGPLPRHRVIRNGRRRPWLSSRRKRPLVVSVGRLWDQAKNLETLDRAAASIDWRVAVLGPTADPDGTERRPAHALALGPCGPDRVWRWLQRASIYALPARYEPFGLSVLEAAACGCALVLGDIPPLRETWDGAASFVAADDSEALAAAIDRLADDAAERSALARRARIRAAALTAESMADGYEAAYRELIASRVRQKTEAAGA